MAWVQGLGLVVRDSLKGIQVFSPPDVLRMRAMSTGRVAWMTVAARARIRLQTPHAPSPKRPRVPSEAQTPG